MSAVDTSARRITMRVEYSLETAATPEVVLGAMTDFTDHRLKVWKGTLDPKKYEVRELGDTWAVVKEGSPGKQVWVLLRYDWSVPGTLRWVLLDSGYAKRGTGEIRVSPGDHGGSRLDVVIHHTGPKGVVGAVVLLFQGLLGPVVFPRLWRTRLDRLAEA
jgi:hypothetical protein